MGEERRAAAAPAADVEDGDVAHTFERARGAGSGRRAGGDVRLEEALDELLEPPDGVLGPGEPRRRRLAAVRVQDAAQIAAEVGLGLGEDDRAVGGDAPRERVLVVVDVLAAALRRGTTIGRLPIVAASMIVPGPPWQTTTAASRIIASISLVAQVLPVLGVRRRRRGAGLDEAAGDPRAAVREPRVDPAATAGRTGGSPCPPTRRRGAGAALRRARR